MTVYLHKYYDEGELLMEVFLPDMTPLDMKGEFKIEKVQVKPTRIEPAIGDTSNVYFNYKNEEHVVLVKNSKI